MKAQTIVAEKIFAKEIPKYIKDFYNKIINMQERRNDWQVYSQHNAQSLLIVKMKLKKPRYHYTLTGRQSC
jgi:hypothetical protein